MSKDYLEAASKQISGVLSPPEPIITNFDSPASSVQSQQQPISGESTSSDVQVRRSTRDIKRKKFDDDWIEGAGLRTGHAAVKRCRQQSSSGAESSVTSPSPTVSNVNFMTPPSSIDFLNKSTKTTESSSTFQPMALEGTKLLLRRTSSVVIENAPKITTTSTLTPSSSAIPSIDQIPTTSSNFRSTSNVVGDDVVSNTAIKIEIAPVPSSVASGSCKKRSRSSKNVTITTQKVIDNVEDNGCTTSSGSVMTSHTICPTSTVGIQQQIGYQHQYNKNNNHNSSIAVASSTSSLTTTAMATLASLHHSSEQTAVAKDVGRWQAADDLALITAVLQCNDLTAVYSGIKFTCHFTLDEIQSRWYALLYEPSISKYAQEAIKNLPVEMVVDIQSKTIFSKAEEKILALLPSTTNPSSVDIFDDLLNKHADVFHYARNAHSLMKHWEAMKHCKLLLDQKSSTDHLKMNATSFSDIEENLDDFEDDFAISSNNTNELSSYPDSSFLGQEIFLKQHLLGAKAKILEGQLEKYNCLVECISGLPQSSFNSSTFAALAGRLVRYLVKSKEITIGRTGSRQKVDVDLSLEGPAFKISRHQAMIKLKTNGDFYLINFGVRPTYVDGKPIFQGSKVKINEGAVIEFACIKLVFSINSELIKSIKNESLKALAVS